MSSEIRCGDVDGRGNWCVWRSIWPDDCDLLDRPCDSNTPCLDLDARHAALVAQLGEAGVRRIVDEWLADAPIRTESAIRDAQGEGE